MSRGEGMNHTISFLLMPVMAIAVLVAPSQMVEPLFLGLLTPAAILICILYVAFNLLSSLSVEDWITASAVGEKYVGVE